MKNDKGITLVSLVIYITVMVLVIGAMHVIISNFYDNTNAIEADTKDILEFNKFNTYFIKEIKSANNVVDNIANDGSYILFTSGNSFYVANNKVYYNDKEICSGISSFKFAKGKNTNGEEDESIVEVTANFENFEKSINYKIEKIY